MAITLEFFCGETDEAELLAFLLGTGDVVPIPTYPLHADVVPVVNVDKRPDWPARWSIYLWLRSAGRIRWLRSHRKKGEPREPLPMDELISPAVLKLIEPPAGKAFVDNLGCAVIEYDRGWRKDGWIGQASLYMAADSMREIGTEFSRWVRRCMGWVRRRSTRVRILDRPASAKPLPMRWPFVSWAMPEACEAIRAGGSRFAYLSLARPPTPPRLVDDDEPG